MTLLRDFLRDLFYLDHLMADPSPNAQRRVLVIELAVILTSAVFFRLLRAWLT